MDKINGNKNFNPPIKFVNNQTKKINLDSTNVSFSEQYKDLSYENNKEE